MKPLSVEMACLLGIQNKIHAVCTPEDTKTIWSFFKQVFFLEMEEFVKINILIFFWTCFKSNTVDLMNTFTYLLRNVRFFNNYKTESFKKNSN